MNQEPPKYFIGLTQWHHPDWYAERATTTSALNTYARHFNSVEGNSSFYGLPSATTIDEWQARSPSHFRFCFKFPNTITHQLKLRHCDRPLAEFLKRISPLEDKLGVLWLQMGASFSPSDIPQLARFLAHLPTDYALGIEVRHPGFFLKDDTEKQFNRLLIEYGVNRITFDTRPLFKHPASDEATQEALNVKPRMPVHVIATGQQPFVRFISPLDLTLGQAYLQPWINKTLQWIDEGRTPYLFFHTPDNREAPELALYFSQTLHQLRPDIAAISLWDRDIPQPELF